MIDGQLDRAKVVEAVDEVRGKRRADLERLGIILDTAALREEFGGWVLPAETASNPGVTSYEIHRVLEDLQRDIEERSRQMVSIVLN